MNYVLPSSEIEFKHWLPVPTIRYNAPVMPKRYNSPVLPDQTKIHQPVINGYYNENPMAIIDPYSCFINVKKLPPFSPPSHQNGNTPIHSPLNNAPVSPYALMVNANQYPVCKPHYHQNGMQPMRKVNPPILHRVKDILDHQQGIKNPKKKSPPPKNYCNLCKQNDEPMKDYMNHTVKFEDGRARCPVLRKYVCELCNATGDYAHTLSYCPLAKGNNSVAIALKLKSTPRDSCGRKRNVHKSF